MTDTIRDHQQLRRHRRDGERPTPRHRHTPHRGVPPGNSIWPRGAGAGRTQTRATNSPCRAVAHVSGACRTPGLYSPVWVPDSGSARSPEPPDANQPPGVVLRPVNRLAHLRLHRHGSLRTGDRPHGIREPADARPGPDGKRVIGLSHMANTSRDRCSEDRTHGGGHQAWQDPSETYEPRARPPSTGPRCQWQPQVTSGIRGRSMVPRQRLVRRPRYSSCLLLSTYVSPRSRR